MDPHKILGLPRDTHPREVRAAFRRYAKQHHPDRGGDEARFRAGVNAYRKLAGTPRHRGEVVFYRRPNAAQAAVTYMKARARPLLRRWSETWRNA